MHNMSQPNISAEREEEFKEIIEEILLFMSRTESNDRFELAKQVALGLWNNH